MAQMKNQGTLNPDSHIFFNQALEEQSIVVLTIMKHISLKAGLKEWVNKARESVKLEMRQVCLRNISNPRHQSGLTNTGKAEVLEYRMFLKLNRSGKINGITVASGNRQWYFI